MQYNLLSTSIIMKSDTHLKLHLRKQNRYQSACCQQEQNTQEQSSIVLSLLPERERKKKQFGRVIDSMSSGWRQNQTFFNLLERFSLRGMFRKYLRESELILNATADYLSQQYVSINCFHAI